MTQLDRETYRVLVEQMPAMLWRADADGRGDYFNPAWLAFTGRTFEQELGEGWWESLHPDDLAAFLTSYRAHVRDRVRYECQWRVRRSDGAYRHLLCHATPHIDHSGNFDGFVGSCLDIEERRLTDTSAADDLFEMSLDNVCVAGFDGYFKRVNPSWTLSLGWGREELMSRPILEFVHPDDRDQVFADRKRLFSGAKLGAIVNRYQCKDGTYRWFEWRSVAHIERKLVYAVARDVTVQRQGEERLRKAEENEQKLKQQLVFADRMASVGTLAAGVAHEINNPLAFVTTNLDLLFEELERLEAHTSPGQLAQLREMAGEAQSGAERIRKIVRGLKTFSRAEEERRSTIDLLPLLQMSINMTLNEIRHRATLIKEFGPVPLVEADDARLGQVFINLLINAAQALPDGESTTHEIRVRTATDEGGRAIVEISDNGSGIPAPLLERIFDPFFTTKPVGIGTGLGLSICHTIVTNIGGEITVDSREGVGTTFRLALPPATTSPQREVAQADADTKPSRRGSVLIVDDEPAIGLVLRRTLREHDVKTTTSASDALALLDEGAEFDVILSDLMMPVMSGMEFFRELERRFPQVAPRVVFVSGGAFTPGAHDFLDSVPNERLDKPFTPQAVRELVMRYVESRQPC